jgi:hypothetical protein
MRGFFKHEILSSVYMKNIDSFLSKKNYQTIAKGLIFLYTVFGLELGVIVFLDQPKWVLIGSLIFFFLITEFISSALIRKWFPVFKNCQDFNIAMEPHIFAHFLPCKKNEDVSNGFRRVTLQKENKKTLSPNTDNLIYLAGDCTIYEEHLPIEETLASQLQFLLGEHQILNAGVSHYTTLHCFNRLVVELINGYRPKKIILSSGINDILAFIHHKQGKANPDHTHLYKPWTNNTQLVNLLSRCPLSTVRLLLCFLFFGKKTIGNWDCMATDISRVYFEPESVSIAKKLINTKVFIKSLNLFLGTCKVFDIELILSTIKYNKEDMEEEPRKTYAYGIDIFNQEIYNYAKNHSLILIDVAEKLCLEPNKDIQNKWHYTKFGNKKRADITFKSIFEY